MAQPGARQRNNPPAGQTESDERLSSALTYYYKRVFPIIFIGGGICIFAIGVFAALTNGAISMPFFLVVPIVLLFGGYYIKQYVTDLADEVLDDGDALIVRNGSKEQRIPLHDITNVSYAPNSSPPRVVLSLRHTTVFGDEIAFCAPVQIVTFSQSQKIIELIRRVERARDRHA
jgi:hypothetical protein